MALLEAEGVEAEVILGGIIPDDDAAALLAQGVAAVYTPKDFEMARIMADIVTITEKHRSGAPLPR
jgi:(2R)-ethylmalonyl-CoA mutase